MRAALITAFASVLVLTGCAQQNQKWPIPQLTVPSGAVPAGIPRELLNEDVQRHLSPDGSQIVEGPNVYTWGRGFTYAMGWDSLVRHVEGQIGPLGYKPFNGSFMKKIPKIPGVADGTLARAWISPDQKYVVGLMNLGFIRDRAPGMLDSGIYNGATANYLLGIDQVKGLPPQFQKQLEQQGGI
jgi:hypothetical protein